MSANYLYIQTLQSLGRSRAEIAIVQTILRNTDIKSQISALKVAIQRIKYERSANPVLNRETLRILNNKLAAWQAEEVMRIDAETRNINAKPNLNKFLREGGAS